MIVYHGTTAAIADAIDAEGFRDGTGFYLTAEMFTGVWISDVPLDINDTGRTIAVTFAVEVDEHRIADYEWIEDGKGYREWLVPAELLNARPRHRLGEDELEELVCRRFAGFALSDKPSGDPTD